MFFVFFEVQKGVLNRVFIGFFGVFSGDLFVFSIKEEGR